LILNTDYLLLDKQHFLYITECTRFNSVKICSACKFRCIEIYYIRTGGFYIVHKFCNFSAENIKYFKCY